MSVKSTSHANTEHLNMSYRTRAILIRQGIAVDDLADKTVDELLEIKNIGPMRAREIFGAFRPDYIDVTVLLAGLLKYWNPRLEEEDEERREALNRYGLTPDMLEYYAHKR